MSSSAPGSLRSLPFRLANPTATTPNERSSTHWESVSETRVSDTPRRNAPTVEVSQLPLCQRGAPKRAQQLGHLVTALTTLAEQGQPDWVIQAQMGHVSPDMMKTYSHIRRKALDEAAAALEPAYDFQVGDEADETEVMSQSASQSGDVERETNENAKENGSSGKTRTYNPPVNSRMLCQLSY